MNSGKNKTRPKQDPLFKTDPETGKLILLPMKLPSTTNSINKDKSSEKRSRGTIFIAPLKLTAADFEEEPSRAAKVRKIDNNSVRKELFNIPPKRSQIRRPSLQNRQSISRRSIATKKVQSKQLNPCELSPLLDMEEMEEELLNKKGCLEGYPFKTPSKPAIKFSKNAKASPFKRIVNMRKKNTPKKATPMKTPDSLSNENEFLELEKMCCTDDTEKENESPISSMCNLLKGTKLNSIKKQNKESNSVMSYITRLENIIEKNRLVVEQFKISRKENLKKISDLLEVGKEQYNNFIAIQEENTNKISEILNALKTSSTDMSNQTVSQDKSPLHKRRSKRLFDKSPVQSKDAKIIVSPVIKCEDLRKSTLTKNLVAKSQQYQIQNPRLQKALNMYNSMRSELSILTTPKLDRQGLIESPKTTNLSRSLSRTIQNQCHLLQDTPVHQ